MSDIDVTKLRSWIGKQAVLYDTISTPPIKGMSATMHIVKSEDEPLPPLWHWLYFLPEVPSSDLVSDAHQKLDKFLPPVPMKRRMWTSNNKGEIAMTAVSTIREK